VIDHVLFEVADLEPAARFYDALFFALGGRRMLAEDGALAWGVDGPVFQVALRGHRGPGFGHVALSAAGKAAVEAAYEAGLGAGGTDDGPPGPRPQHGPRGYAAALRDPDGLRVELVTR
jgi:catechol 2,3-dioxygenase-like lactoylglutathione lyase family enzyme